jgi:hypothetical protein
LAWEKLETPSGEEKEAQTSDNKPSSGSISFAGRAIHGYITLLLLDIIMLVG